MLGWPYVFPGRVLARISILPKISRIWLCLRVQTDRCMTRFLMFSKRISRYFESKQYRNPGQDASWENGTYGHPNICLVQISTLAVFALDHLQYMMYFLYLAQVFKWRWRPQVCVELFITWWDALSVVKMQAFTYSFIFILNTLHFKINF